MQCEVCGSCRIVQGISTSDLSLFFILSCHLVRRLFFYLRRSPPRDWRSIGAAVLGCATFAVAADVAPPLLLPAGGGGSAGGGVPVLPGPQDSIIVGEPHVSGLRNIEDDSIKRMWTLVTARSIG